MILRVLTAAVLLFVSMVLSSSAFADTNSTPLFDAVKAGDLSEVTRLINTGAEVNTKDDRGKTPLDVAVWEEHLDVAELLIRDGAAVDARSGPDATPLFIAVLVTNVPMAEMLISYNANVNVKDVEGRTPLHWAARKGPLMLAELLIRNGADVNSSDTQGETPLHWAVELREFRIVELLLASGANINAGNQRGETPLHVALAYEPVASARKSEYASIAELLIKSGADVRAADMNGNTPLHKAASGGYYDVAKILIEKGVDVNALASFGTPLHNAGTYFDLLELLFDKGAEIDTRDDLGFTPLHRVAQSGNVKSVNFLISKGADVNAISNDGRTPLDLAVYWGQSEVADVFRTHQARLGQECQTVNDIETVNKDAITRIFDLQGLDARVFLALDPRLLLFKEEYELLMKQNIDQVIVWRITRTAGLAAAVPFVQGCVVVGYGEPDVLEKLNMMRDVLNLIKTQDMDHPQVRVSARVLATYGMPEDSPEVVMTRVEMMLGRVQDLLE